MSRPKGQEKENASGTAKPFLSVLFACCQVYQRIYRNPEATAYVGRCPKCGKSVRFVVGADGTEARNFVVY